MSRPPLPSAAQDAAGQFRQRLEQGEPVLGCFLSLGSALTSEIMGSAGYDWGLIDLEHGAGSEADALGQMQGLAAAGTIAIVRVESNERQRVHRVLDFGAHGVMFPRIDTAADAVKAVAAMRYPPAGVRGVAFSNRSCGYGSNFRPYLTSTNLLTVIQIETQTAIDNVQEIAAVDGVDVLFVGPWDLSHSLGVLGDFEHPAFKAAVDQTVRAARAHGKALGILLPSAGELGRFHALGFRFIASGSDAVLLHLAAKSLVETLTKARTELQKSATNQA
jgi:2-keto-3-deoxy-L-rhamnonate aldolase RhmA